jgi:mannose PTS system EIIA component
MISVLILAHHDIAMGMMSVVHHTYAKSLPQLDALGVDYDRSPDELATIIPAAIQRMDSGDGVLVLSDIHGATHTNVASRSLQAGRIEMITGVNLPMLLRVLTYRHLLMDELINKAMSGGWGGIVVCAAGDEHRVERKA